MEELFDLETRSQEVSSDAEFDVSDWDERESTDWEDVSDLSDNDLYRNTIG
jgi:hypothetical protein